MKRILVDLSEETISVLDSMARGRELSRAKVLREAVAEYVVRHAGTPLEPPKPLEGFAAMKGIFGDGREYQRNLRAEWD